MGTERVLMLKLLGDTASMDRSLRRTEGRLKSFGRGVAKWGTAVVADLAITGVEKLTDALGDAWTGFREGEQAAGQLGTTWKNLGLGGSKLAGTIDDISAMAKRLGVDDTESIMAFNKALQNTGGKPKQAMDRLRIAQDLVANGSAPNLSAAMKLIAQAGKGSARVVDAFGLKSKTAGGRIKELGEKVKGAAKKKAALDPLGTLFNAMNEDLEGIVGSFASGDLEGALASLAQVGTDVGSTWSKLYDPVSKVLDKLLGGERYGPGGEQIGSTFGDISASIGGFLDRISQAADTILPKVQEGFTHLGELWDALQPHVQNAMTAIQPLVDLFSSSAQGGLAFVLDAVNGVLQTITDLLKGDFSAAFTSAGETVGKLATDLDQALLGIPSTITAKVGEIGTAALGIGQEILNKVIDNAGLIPAYLVDILVGEEGIVGKLGSAVGSIITAAGGIGQGIFDGIVNTVLSIPDVVVGIIRSAANQMVGLWNQLDFSIPPFTIPGIDKVVVPDPLGGSGFEVFGGVGPTRIWDGSDDLIPDIKPFAKGGIVRSPTLGLVGEAGPEAIIPLDRRHGMGATINITINAGVGSDPASIGRAVTEALRAYSRNGGGAAIRAAVNG